MTSADQRRQYLLSILNAPPPNTTGAGASGDPSGAPGDAACSTGGLGMSDAQLSALLARGEAERLLFEEDDARRVAAEAAAAARWAAARGGAEASAGGPGAGGSSACRPGQIAVPRLATAEDCAALIRDAVEAAAPKPRDDPAMYGRGMRGAAARSTGQQSGSMARRPAAAAQEAARPDRQREDPCDGPSGEGAAPRPRRGRPPKSSAATQDGARGGARAAKRGRRELEQAAKAAGQGAPPRADSQQPGSNVSSSGAQETDDGGEEVISPLTARAGTAAAGGAAAAAISDGRAVALSPPPRLQLPSASGQEAGCERSCESEEPASVQEGACSLLRPPCWDCAAAEPHSGRAHKRARSEAAVAAGAAGAVTAAAAPAAVAAAAAPPGAAALTADPWAAQGVGALVHSRLGPGTQQQGVSADEQLRTIVGLLWHRCGLADTTDGGSALETARAAAARPGALQVSAGDARLISPSSDAAGDSKRQRVV